MLFDYEGKLYVDSNNDGKGFAFDWDYNTIKIVSLSDDSITATINRSLSDEFDEINTVNLVNENGKWLIANDFIYDTPIADSGTQPVDLSPAQDLTGTVTIAGMSVSTDVKELDLSGKNISDITILASLSMVKRQSYNRYVPCG